MSGGTVQLADGRSLGYAEYGEGVGRPVLHFHGLPGSRFEASLLDAAASSAGVRLIGIDRPGMGLSSHRRGRRLLDWPGDVIQLADTLGFERFAVTGVSGGSPYAAACAFKIPDRLSGCGIIAGTGPIDPGTEGLTRSNRITSLIARRMPLLLRLMMWRDIGRFRDNPDKLASIISKLGEQLPEVDRGLFEDPGIQEHFVTQARESFRQGARGPAHDAAILFGHPWGFRLEDITEVPVFLWHGELDRNVPVSMGRDVASRIPNCTAMFRPEEGHLSLLIRHAEEILARLPS